MRYVLLLLLAIAWAAVLLPPYLRNRRHARTGDSIALFNRHLSVLERANPVTSVSRMPSRPRFHPARSSTGVTRPVTRGEGRQRRRDVLAILAAAVLATLAGAVVIGGPIVILHLAVDGLAAFYLALLVHYQRISTEREMKVRLLRVPEPVAEPALLRTSVN